MTPEDQELNNGLAALKTVNNFLTEIGWEPQPTEDKEAVLVDFSEENTPIRDAHFIVRVPYERFLCYFNFKDMVTAKLQSEVTTFINRANSGMVIGNFEYDMDTGAIRFKASLDFTQTELTTRLLRNTIKSAMDAVERYADVLAEVIQGTKSAISAINEAEESM